MNAILVVDDLTVSFSGLRAVDHVSFRLSQGEVLGLIGPNGAGKTTCIDALSGMVRYSGRVNYGGTEWNPGSANRRARAGLGRTFQSLHLFEDLSVVENVAVGVIPKRPGAFVRDLLGSRSPGPTAVAETLERCGLKQVADQRVSTLPNGARHLVAIARALAMHPSVVLLDEPAAGLDTSERAMVAHLISELRADGTAAILVEHDLDFVAAACDRVLVMDAGRLIATETPSSLRNNPEVQRAYLGVTLTESLGKHSAEGQGSP